MYGFIIIITIIISITIIFKNNLTVCLYIIYIKTHPLLSYQKLEGALLLLSSSSLSLYIYIFKTILHVYILTPIPFYRTKNSEERSRNVTDRIFSFLWALTDSMRYSPLAEPIIDMSPPTVNTRGRTTLK